MASGPNMKQVLNEVQTTSDEFQLPGGTTLITLNPYVSGTWTLQMQTPDDEWVPYSDVTFKDVGQKAFVSVFGPLYRITAGGAGSKAWVSTNTYQPGLI